MYMESKKKNGTDEPSCRAGIKRKTENGVDDMGWKDEAGAK